MTVDAAKARLAAAYYNSGGFDPVTNPGGFDVSADGLTEGHIVNLPASLADVGVVAGYVGEQAALAGQSAASAGAAVEAMVGMVTASSEANDLAVDAVAASAATAQSAAAAAVEASALVRGLEIGLAAGGYARLATISGASIEIGLAAGGWAVVSLT
jgi:hypothetical protein